MEKVLVGRNGFLAQAVQRVAEPSELTVIGSTDFDLINGAPDVLEALQGKDLLIDTADYYPGIVATSENPVEVYETNVKMYENLFALAQQNGVKKIVTIGTTGCYPVTDELLNEDMFDGDVSKLNKKLASYALSRFTLLDIAALYRNQFGIEHSHLILPNFYGPGDKYEVGRSHLLASWVRDFHAAKERGETSIELWGQPTQRREFISEVLRTIARNSNPPELEQKAYTELNRIIGGLSREYGSLPLSNTDSSNLKGTLLWEYSKLMNETMGKDKNDLILLMENTSVIANLNQAIDTQDIVTALQTSTTE